LNHAKKKEKRKKKKEKVKPQLNDNGTAIAPKSQVKHFDTIYS
jgi:hypothetical protein